MSGSFLSGMRSIFGKSGSGGDAGPAKEPPDIENKIYQLRLEGANGRKFTFEAQGVVKTGIDEKTGAIMVGKFQKSIKGETPDTITIECAYLNGQILPEIDHEAGAVHIGLIVDGELVAEMETKNTPVLMLDEMGKKPQLV